MPPNTHSRARVILPGGRALTTIGMAALAACLGTSIPVAGVAAETGIAPPPHSAVGTPVGPRIIRGGDTLFSLAVQHGTTVADLQRLNGLGSGHLLMPGRTLLVPLGLAASPPVQAVAAAMRVDAEASSVAAAYEPGSAGGAGAADAGSGVSIGVEAQQASADERLGPPDPVFLRYVVEPGDTLGSIARQFGMTAAPLGALNGLSGETLYPGDELRVPRSGRGPEGADGPKRIEIDVSDQRMYVWQGPTLVWSFVASTGMDGYPTRRGSFAVQSKVDNAWSTAWQLWMPHWLGIYWAGGSENGIHALPIINGQMLWESVLGTPVSYGCIVLATDDARRLYEWADMGTPVEIRD